MQLFIIRLNNVYIRKEIDFSLISKKYDSMLSSTIATANISNIIGSESSYMFNFFKNKFPENFFKSNYISQQLNSFKVGKSFPSQRLPLVAMSTNYELEDTTMGNIAREYTTIYTMKKRDKKNYYRLIFADEENDVFIYSVDNRMSLRHNYAIKLQTQAQAWNVVNYLNQNFENGGKNFINDVKLTALIPNEFILNICNKFGWHITGPEYSESEKKFDREKLREYLLRNGLGSITEEINPETGNTSYMYDYTANLLVSYPDLPQHESATESLIETSAIVRYQIATELWFPAAFILDFDGDFKRQNPSTLEDETTMTKFSFAVEKRLIPRKLNNGYQFIKQARYTPDMNVPVDTISLTSFFTDDLINIIRSSKFYHLDVDKFAMFILFKNNKPVTDGSCVIDFEKLELRFSNPESNCLYTLVLYGDLYKINILSDYINKGIDHDLKKLDIYPDYKVGEEDYVVDSDK